MRGRVDAGVTWLSEALFKEQDGHPIGCVDIPAADNATAIHAGAVVRNAAHPQAARAWLSFIRSPAALPIFERDGFKRPPTSPRDPAARYNQNVIARSVSDKATSVKLSTNPRAPTRLRLPLHSRIS